MLGRWPRFGGWLIDYLVIGYAARVLEAGTWGVLAAAVALALSAAYRIVGVHRWGTTLGKAAVGAKVVDQHGEIPSWRAAAIRWAVPAVVGVVRLASIVGGVYWLALLLWATVVYAPILRRDDRRGLHDRAAGTWVVETRSAR